MRRGHLFAILFVCLLVALIIEYTEPEEIYYNGNIKMANYTFKLRENVSDDCGVHPKKTVVIKGCTSPGSDIIYIKTGEYVRATEIEIICRHEVEHTHQGLACMNDRTCEPEAREAERNETKYPFCKVLQSKVIEKGELRKPSFLKRFFEFLFLT